VMHMSLQASDEGQTDGNASFRRPRLVIDGFEDGLDVGLDVGLEVELGTIWDSTNHRTAQGKVQSRS
jgi:hypothetical protein